MTQLPEELKALGAYSKFIVWKAVQVDGEPKPVKVPISYVDGTKCDAHDAANWTTFEHAAAVAPLFGATGVGFVLTPGDPFCCIDLDHCLVDGQYTEFSRYIMSVFPNAATELSYSGDGLHLWFQYDPAQLPPNHRTRSKDVPGLEVYTSNRFIALGPRVFHGDAGTQYGGPLAWLLAQYLPGTTSAAMEWSDQPVPEWNGPEDDAELLAKMLDAKKSAASVFGGKASFRDLWEGNVEALAATYGSPVGADFDHSAADAALMSHLAFWTGKNCERMDRLFRQSALMRPKYEDRPDYRQNTVTEACGWTEKVYGQQGNHPELNDLLDALDQSSTPDKIEEILTVIALLDPARRDAALKKIKSATDIGLGTLREMLKKQVGGSADLGLEIADIVLTRYFQNGDHLVRAMDSSFWGYLETHWLRMTDEQVLKRIVTEVEAKADPNINTASITNQALKIIIAKQAADGDVLRLACEPLPIINCKNGELWINDDGSSELRPHRHDSYLTYCLDVEWNPQATAPTFLKALGDIFSDNVEMIHHALELMGYILQPCRPFASWFMLWGPGANGKTVLIETLQRLMGPDSFVSDRIDNIEGSPFKIGALAGKLLLVDDDVDTGTVLPDGFLKKVSERKGMTGQHKFKAQFNFIACCLPVLLANNLPSIKDLSNGTRRRAHIIPFCEQFLSPEQAKAEEKRGNNEYRTANPAVFRHIWANEMSGVLSAAVWGLQQLMKRGGFNEPQPCIDARDQWLASASPLVSFISDECECKPDLRQTTTEFYNAFKSWLIQQGFQYPITQTKVTRDLEALGYVVRKSDGQRWVYGIKAPSPMAIVTPVGQGR